MSSSRTSQDFDHETVMESKRPLLQTQSSESASTSHNNSPTSSIVRQALIIVVSMVIGGLLVIWALACIGVWQYLDNQAQLPTAMTAILWGSASSPAIAPATIIDPPVKTSAGDCGSTPQEAKALGCEFDIMLTGWIHPRCIDRELSNRYVREGGAHSQGWKFFWDQAATMEIPLEEVMKGDYDIIFSTWGFHQGHCGYLWQQVQREQLTKPVGQRVLPADAWSKEHIGHCINFTSYPNVSHIEENDAMLTNHVSGCLIA